MLGVGGEPPVPEFLIDAAYASPAQLAILPMQDLLARDSGAPDELAGHRRSATGVGASLGADVPASARRSVPRSVRLARRAVA